MVPRDEPPVGIRGRPFRDLLFSGSLGCSQSKAGDVVEKHRVAGRIEIEGTKDYIVSMAEADCSGAIDLHDGRKKDI